MSAGQVLWHVTILRLSITQCRGMILLFLDCGRETKPNWKSMRLQVESALLNAKPHNTADTLPQIESIQQIVMAINALSKVLKIPNFLCEVVNCSWFGSLLFPHDM